MAVPDQPEPSTVESGPVTLVPVVELHPTKDLSGPSNPTTDPTTSTSSDDDFVSLEELKKMSLEDLQQFCRDNQISQHAPTEAWHNQQDLLDWLLSEFGVDA